MLTIRKEYKQKGKQRTVKKTFW